MFLQFATSDREWPKDRFDKLRKLVIVNTATFLQRRHKHQLTHRLQGHGGGPVVRNYPFYCEFESR